MKILFVVQPHSFVDVITNSSSELFVGKSQTIDTMRSFIKEVYPDYLNEYYDLKSIDDLSTNDLNTYFYHYCSPNKWPADIFDYPIPKGFTFEELFEPEIDWKTGEPKPPAWNGQIQYRLKENNGYSFVTDENFEELKHKLDPNKRMFFLFSKDDNPDWEKQILLSEIMERMHLG